MLYHDRTPKLVSFLISVSRVPSLNWEEQEQGSTGNSVFLLLLMTVGKAKSYIFRTDQFGRQTVDGTGNILKLTSQGKHNKTK